MRNSLLTSGILSAMLSSLCCITPVFALMAGVSGIATTFSWLDPARPFFVGITVLVLGFSWYQKLKPRTEEEIACECDTDQQPSFWQSKRFLGIITVFAGLMLSFPSYAHIFYSNGGGQTPVAYIEQDSTKTNKIVLDVKGMTCAGCEAHIEHEVGALQGVKFVDAIYAEGSATIEYLPSKLEEKTIIEAINKTGYTVIEKPKDQ
ncbi:mercuric transport protein MerTP [Ekhidna sp.]|uniref:mercuric transport protein MerTP n=1 Tax=Ekhidna sp. TaxID=2608089 RepID=UPI0032EC286A